MDESDIKVEKSMHRNRRESKLIFIREVLHDQAEANLDDFTIVKRLGEGACGKVYLVQHSLNGKLYAMKAIRKDLVIEMDQLENLYTEKNVLETADNPFLINMDFIFQNELHIYFIMPFIKGGMLFDHLQNLEGVFTEYQVKFFIMQVAIGLGHLHNKGIVYRDLKPENVLIGEDGYLVVCDYGIAKMLQGGEATYSSIGTMEYMAPEMIKASKGYAHAVDWWALGTLLYELLIGIPPFYHHNQHKMAKMITSKKK